MPEKKMYWLVFDCRSSF